MKRIVISQPMYFPWVGLFEQVRLADIYVHYDDVQFSKGHFANRVQVKTAQGSRWMTVPLADLHLGQLINQVVPDDSQPWREQHLALLSDAYRGAPFAEEMLQIVHRVFSLPYRTLSELSIASMHAICEYFDLAPRTQFLISSNLKLAGRSSERVLAIVKHLQGDVYITGLGARNYLDHELFEQRGVAVEYIDYRLRRYEQLHGDFTPYVSTLDLVANLGKAGHEVFCSGTVGWRDFVAKKS
jgi:hypothetical protein